MSITATLNDVSVVHFDTHITWYSYLYSISAYPYQGYSVDQSWCTQRDGEINKGPSPQETKNYTKKVHVYFLCTISSFWKHFLWYSLYFTAALAKCTAELHILLLMVFYGLLIWAGQVVMKRRVYFFGCGASEPNICMQSACSFFGGFSETSPSSVA